MSELMSQRAPERGSIELIEISDSEDSSNQSKAAPTRTKDSQEPLIIVLEDSLPEIDDNAQSSESKSQNKRDSADAAIAAWLSALPDEDMEAQSSESKSQNKRDSADAAIAAWLSALPDEDMEVLQDELVRNNWDLSKTQSHFNAQKPKRSIEDDPEEVIRPHKVRRENAVISSEDDDDKRTEEEDSDGLEDSVYDREGVLEIKISDSDSSSDGLEEASDEQRIKLYVLEDMFPYICKKDLYKHLQNNQFDLNKTESQLRLES